MSQNLLATTFPRSLSRSIAAMVLSGCAAPVESVDLYGAAAVGLPCEKTDEQSPEFAGFSLGEVNIEVPSEACGVGGCLAHDFQGRTHCPEGNLDGGRCFTPDGQLVTVPVAPQLESRPPEDHVYCTCRCEVASAGPSLGGFAPDDPPCRCPSGFFCATVFGDGVCVKDLPPAPAQPEVESMQVPDRSVSAPRGL